MESVRHSILDSSLHGLPENLKNLDFSHREAALISLAVALTRRMTFPEDIGRCIIQTQQPAANSRATALEQLLDCLSVVFMFNIVNRLANFHQLEPEWTAPIESAWTREWVRGLLAWGVGLQMSLASDVNDRSMLANEEKVKTLVATLGVPKPSDVWGTMRDLPSPFRAIVDIVAKTAGCNGLPRLMRDPKCRYEFQLENERVEQPEIWDRLFSHPWTVEDDMGEKMGLSREQEVDFLFRIAVLASIAKLESPDAKFYVETLAQER